MKTFSSLLTMALATSTVSAFAPINMHPSASSSLASKLNDIDLMAIENVANLCLHAEEFSETMAEGCDLDEHEALVNQLTEQRDIMAGHVAELDGLLSKLKGHVVDGHTLLENGARS